MIYSQGLALHGVEYRDDEIFYFNSTREMMETGDYLSPTYFGENRFQKPILFYWFVVAAYKVLGINWFAARSVSVVFAALTVCLTWLLSQKFFRNARISHLSALILMVCPLFFRHAKNVVPDMALTFFTALACFFVLHLVDYCKEDDKKRERLTLGLFVAMALGFMVKGLAAVLIPCLLLFFYSLAVDKFSINTRIPWLKGIGIFLLICLPWFLYMVFRHGGMYMDYMLSFETKQRILGVEQSGGFIIARITQFFNNMLFYLQTLFQYFSPWSLFLIPALPLIITRMRKNHQHKNALLYLSLWMIIVFLIFSFMDFKISHYMMSLAVPYAIILSYFCNETFSRRKLSGNMLHLLRENYLLLMLILCACVYAFFIVYVLKWNPWNLMVVVLGLVFAVSYIKIKNKPHLPAFILAGMLLFILLQMPLISKSGLTTHNVLRQMANVVHSEKSSEYAVGVGSHDLHEKEFQVYFDQKIEKLATNHEGYNMHHLKRMFNYSKDVFCLMTEKDYNYYFDKAPLNEFRTEVLREEYVARKRFHFDRQFWQALFAMNQDKVYEYIMEKVVLIRKVDDA